MGDRLDHPLMIFLSGSGSRAHRGSWRAWSSSSSPVLPLPIWRASSSPYCEAHARAQRAHCRQPPPTSPPAWISRASTSDRLQPASLAPPPRPGAQHPDDPELPSSPASRASAPATPTAPLSCLPRRRARAELEIGEPYRVAAEALIALNRLEEAEDALQRFIHTNSSCLRSRATPASPPSSARGDAEGPAPPSARRWRRRPAPGLPAAPPVPDGGSARTWRS